MAPKDAQQWTAELKATPRLSFARMKLVVADLDAAERFYNALGFETVWTTCFGEGETRQEQRSLAAGDESNGSLLGLAHLPGLPPPPRPTYPGSAWLVLAVADVDAAIATTEREGGSVISPAEDYPDADVRATIVSDPQGHIVEFVGPIPPR